MDTARNDDDSSPVIIQGSDLTDTSRQLADRVRTLWMAKKQQQQQQQQQQRIQQQQQNQQDRFWIAVVGMPGSGKSTVAQAVVDQLQEAAEAPLEPTTTSSDPPPAEVAALVVPMDGYHYTNEYLSLGGGNLRRKGASYTFDATRLGADLRRAATTQSTTSIYFPAYSRKISNPVERALALEPRHQVVLVEGLYLLLGRLAPPPPLPHDNNHDNSSKADDRDAVSKDDDSFAVSWWEDMAQSLEWDKPDCSSATNNPRSDDDNPTTSSSNKLLTPGQSLRREVERWYSVTHGIPWDDTWYIEPTAAVAAAAATTKDTTTHTTVSTDSGGAGAGAGAGGAGGSSSLLGSPLSASTDAAGRRRIFGWTVSQQRLVERSLQTWTPAKTQLWGGATDRESATRRVAYNDAKNARLVVAAAAAASGKAEQQQQQNSVAARVVVWN